MAEKKDQKNVVMLKGVRLNMFGEGLYFPEVEQVTKGRHKGKYRFNWSSKFILPPKDTDEGESTYNAIMRAIKEAKRIKWGEKADDIKIKRSNTPLQDGDDEEANTFDPMKGAYFISASKTVYGKQGDSEEDVPSRPFRVIGARKVKDPRSGELKFSDVSSGQEGAPYSGCYVNLKVELWGQDADSERGIPNRINATILAVQFAKHGEAFGGGTRTNVDDEFDEVDGDDDDDLGSSKSTTSSLDDDDDDDL